MGLRFRSGYRMASNSNTDYFSPDCRARCLSSMPLRPSELQREADLASKWPYRKCVKREITRNLRIENLHSVALGDNLILACRSCNSSKGKKDLMEWYDFKGEFPPLLIFRRYLKLLIRYCSIEGLMDTSWKEAIELDIPFDLKFLPDKFPSPESLIFKHETRLQQTAWGDSFHSCPSSTFC
jgi:hypothetical protein